MIAPLTVDNPSLDEDGAYAIALEVYRRRVERGEGPVGRKIGFTNRSIWRDYRNIATHLGLHVRLDRARTPTKAPSPSPSLWAILLHPGIEPEIQLHVARTPPVTGDERAILGCVDWIAHGFEIVQCPFPDWRFAVVDTIAAYAVHGTERRGNAGAGLGDRGLRGEAPELTVALSRDGSQQAEGIGSNVLGSPLLALAHLTEVLSRQSRFPPVRAGEVITTGTLTELFPVSPGETWSTTVSGIELPGLSIAIE